MGEGIKCQGLCIFNDTVNVFEYVLYILLLLCILMCNVEPLHLLVFMNKGTT